MQNKNDFRHSSLLLVNNGNGRIAVFVTLLLGAFLVLSGCASASSLGTTNASGTPTSAATISHPATATPPASTKLPPLIALHMIDGSTGWAFTQPNLYTIGGYILRTTDGGQHWNNVSPPYPSTTQQYDDGETTEFLNASIAWVVTARYRVFHTTDGGQTWQKSQIVPPIKGSKASYMTFSNPLNGWIIFTAAVNDGVAVTIFRTNDGGNSWTIISSSGTSTTQLPIGTYDWSFGFLNASTGWACAGYGTFSDPAHFYVTHDGGTTWQRQPLPLPTGEPHTRLQILAPMFFTRSDGLLPVLFYVNGNDEGLAMYVTHNSGTSWTSTTPLSTSIPQSGGATQTLAGFSSVNMNDAWIIGDNGMSLHTTNDAGQHWTTVSTPIQSAIHAISFISALAGWAIVKPDFDTSSLYRTIDGGRTWTELFHTVEGKTKAP